MISRKHRLDQSRSRYLLASVDRFDRSAERISASRRYVGYYGKLVKESPLCAQYFPKVVRA
jgi:hypothetical protein